MILLPLGHEHFSVRRLPWVTLTLFGLCIVVHLYVSATEAPILARLEAIVAEANEVQRELAMEDAAALLEAIPKPKGMADEAPEGEGQVERNAQRARARKARLTRDLARLQADQLALSETLPTVRLGYRPSHDGVFSMVTAAFTHGGWFHLLGNLLFLYMVGLNMEDRWGKLRFLALYAAGILTSALAFKLWHPQGSDVLVGASGAIAALMGAFAVAYARTRIRFAYAFWITLKPRWGTFWAPAWLALPFWFLEQAVMSLFEASQGASVAYSAHVGGFLLGLVVAVAMRYTGSDARLREQSEHSADPRDHWTRDPALADAEGLVRDGRRAEALAVLEELLARHPDHDEARSQALDQALVLHQPDRIRSHAAAELTRLVRRGAAEQVAGRYRALREAQPELDLGEPVLRALLAVSGTQAVSPRLSIDVVAQLLQHHPESVLVPRGLWLAAEAQAASGRDDLARRTLERLLSEHPMDAFAERAKRRLAGGPASLPPRQ